MRGGQLFVILILMSSSIFAQDVETLVVGEIEHGGFGGPVIKAGMVNNEAALFVGGRGGWVIDHTLVIGGGGYGLVNAVNAKVPSQYGDNRVEFAYGGFEIEYIRHYDRLIHWSFLVLIGAGGVGYRSESDPTPGMSYDRKSDEVFVVEPSVNATLNITSYLRISGGVSYRHVTGVSTAASTNALLSGPSGVLTFRFGKF